MIMKWRNQKEIPTPKIEVGKKLDYQSGTYTEKTHRKLSEQLFSQQADIQ